MSSATSPCRVLYVALDACDAELMLRLAASGSCPTFAMLLEQGAVIQTRAPEGTFVGSSWMTIATGRDVGTHGYWNWTEIDTLTYEPVGTTPRSVTTEPFWMALSQAGRQVAVLDVPHSPVPAAGFNGIVLKEWGCHDRHDGTGSFPADVLEELDRSVGRHPVGCHSHPGGDDAFAPCDYLLREGSIRTIDEQRRLLQLLRDGAEAKRRASLQLLSRGGWDLFATVLGEAHCVGHQLWHVHDREHPRHDPAARSLLGDPVEEIYSTLDSVVGDLIAAAGHDAAVYVQMNHGMGPHFDGYHLLDQLLHRIDLGLRGQFEPGALSRAARTVLDHVPTKATPLASRFAAAGVRARARYAPPTWSDYVPMSPDRRFFRIPGNTAVGAVRFNLLGREANGIVPPAELDRLCSELATALKAVIDIDSGLPLVRSVRRSDDALSRSPGDRFPDLFVEWERSKLIERVWSPLTGVVCARYDHWRTGDHHDGGMVLVRGRGVAPGRRHGRLRLEDIAPTICASLGVELPMSDGMVRSDLVAGAATRETSDPPVTQATITALEESLADLRTQVESSSRFTDQLRAATGDLEVRIAKAERERLIWTTMAWLAMEPVDDEPLISVITPTFARPARLAEAIRSVRAQRHQNWEMVIVDDGSGTAAEVVEPCRDDRLRVIDAEHGGACAARNIGLDLAKGDVITYLDDDNWFDPGWLHAVSWAFRNHPESSVLYGARVFDDESRSARQGSGGWPWVQFNRFDRRALEHAMFADMGVIAHRATKSTRFDESLIECGDWDFFLSLTVDETPIEVPVIAFYYRTDGHDRLTGVRPTDEDKVRLKWAEWRERAHGSAR